jgi:hypothetical protein
MEGNQEPQIPELDCNWLAIAKLEAIKQFRDMCPDITEEQATEALERLTK